MKKKVSILMVAALGFSLVNTGVTALAADASAVNNVKKYDVSIDKTLYTPFEKSTDSYFKGGFLTGYGSAITFKGLDANGNPQFYAITDRGPNIDAPTVTLNGNSSASKIFPSPQFTPSIGILTIKDGKAIVENDIKIKDSTAKNVSGLPLPNGATGSTGEVALDSNYKALPFDKNGIDTEGIAVDKNGNFWICDEYGPFIKQLDKSGKTIKTYAPGAGLPEVLKYRTANRGFEGLTISPSGKIYASMQSILNVDGKTSKTATFVRIIELDPKTNAVKTYGYPVNINDYKSANDCKLGDIYAINDKTLLVIEQGTLKNGTMSNLIYKVDLSKATDITAAKYKGAELEYVADASLLINDYKFAAKEKFVDLRDFGWTAEKAEGICLFNNNKSIAVINDNDFGVALEIQDKDLGSPKIGNYTYDIDKSQWTYKSVTKPIMNIKQNTEPAQIWVMDLKTALK